MARPPKYASLEEKPVSVTLRIPRDLYDHAQQHAKRRQTTLTELVREGLQMRLETPTDPRDILATQDNTVMQELRQMIADEVQAALAAQRFQTPETTARRQRAAISKTKHYSNALQEQTYAPAPGHSLLTEPTPARKGADRVAPWGSKFSTCSPSIPKASPLSRSVASSPPANPSAIRWQACDARARCGHRGRGTHCGTLSHPRATRGPGVTQRQPGATRGLA